MKYLYFTVFVLFFSCSKSIEENCFINNEKEPEYVEKVPLTAKEIINDKPTYLEIISLKKFRKFKEDSLYVHDYKWDNYESKIKIHDQEFKAFKELFSEQFMCFAKQQTGNILYSLGQNNLGYWLLKIENNKPSAYFLGLSFSHYYLNEVQENPIIKDGFLQIEGSLVKIVKVPGLPGHDASSAIEEGKLFKINLKDLVKDSDNDGYNDIFEKSFGLNPESKDTDNDGMNDFEDLNPMFKSEKNKFTELYQLMLPSYHTTLDFKKMSYYFEVFESDCDYFHHVNPDSYRVLFASEDENNQTDYIKVTDVFNFGVSKIRRNETSPERFYIYKWSNGSSTSLAVEYKNGKWEITVVGQTVS